MYLRSTAGGTAENRPAPLVCDTGDATARATAYIVVYDPNGGFVTGGGWIPSAAGDCTLCAPCQAASGEANFGFVSKYQRGATTPSGNTEFEFKAGNFRSKALATSGWLSPAPGRSTRERAR